MELELEGLRRNPWSRYQRRQRLRKPTFQQRGEMDERMRKRMKDHIHARIGRYNSKLESMLRATLHALRSTALDPISRHTSHTDTALDFVLSTPLFYLYALIHAKFFKAVIGENKSTRKLIHVR